jgi:hypothetical protein
LRVRFQEFNTCWTFGSKGGVFGAPEWLSISKLLSVKSFGVAHVVETKLLSSALVIEPFRKAGLNSNIVHCNSSIPFSLLQLLWKSKNRSDRNDPVASSPLTSLIYLSCLSILSSVAELLPFIEEFSEDH